MVVGFEGNTGSTLLGTLALLGKQDMSWADVPSSVSGHVDAPPPREARYAGWDLGDGDLGALISRKGLIPGHLVEKVSALDVMAFPAIATALDYASVSGHVVDGAAEIGSAIDCVAANVRTFREASNVTRPIVIYLGSPARRAPPPLCDVTTERQLRSRAHNSVPGSLIYAAGAICAGADFVDFTPSEALTSPALWSLADANGMQLVGRDGSTGQTMLKAAVASMLKIRGLAPRSWYSSNHLGNEDGRVLAEPDYRWLKLADKARGLEELVGGDVDHVVSIDYMSSKGDRKESFDSVTARDLFGGEVRLRLNWEAWDSALATPMLLDLIRLVLLGQTLELRGVQGQLGFFFKSPVGAACMSPEQAHREMVAFYTARRG